MKRSRHGVRSFLALSAVLAFGPSAGVAQGGSFDRYLNHQELTRSVQDLVGRHSNLASVRSFVRTDAGRDVWLITIGNPRTGPLEEKPAMLLVANLEGNHLIGSSTALFTAEHLLSQYGRDAEVTKLVDERTIYILPRMNPDGAELYWSQSGYEIPFKPHRSAPELGGLNAREIGRDLNGDGVITMMRQRHPEGEWIVDSDDPRLMRRANRARAERGEFRVFLEGIDTTLVNAYVPMGSDGVNLNRNFPHEYLYFQPHSGPHQVSEVESRALADFMFEQTNIQAVMAFSPYDNLRTAPPAQRSPAPGTAPGPPTQPSSIQAQDRPFYQFVTERFNEMTGLRGTGADGEAGSFAQYAYYQVGLFSWTTPVWTLPEGAGGAGGGAGGTSADHRWLRYFDSAGIDGFVNWTSATHPQLGAVEVGGFKPNVRVNPPVSEIRELAEKHAQFAVWLGNQTGQVDVIETQVEPRGEGVWLVTATVQNDRYLPTQTQIGARVRFNRPINVRLLPVEGMTVLTGNIQQQTPRLEGMGARRTFTWLVQARAGTNVTLEVFAERAGGTQSQTLTLR